MKLDSAASKSAGVAFDDIDTDKKGEVESSLFESLLDSLGEGFHGEELDKQLSLVDPGETGMIGRSSFIGWYVHLVGGNKDDKDDSSSLDSDERAERAEELEKISAAFSELSNGNIVQSINTVDFSQLMEAMGTAYCEEAHRRTVKKLDSGGIITQDAFTSWYIEWLFGDGDDDSIGDEESSDGDDVVYNTGESTDRDVSSSSKAVASSWGGIFVSDAGSWKCDSCMVKNKTDVTVCVACETPRPGHEEQGTSANVGGSEALSSSAGSSIGVGGFTFGGAVTSAMFGASSSASTGVVQSDGFKFGAPSVASEASGGSDAKKEDGSGIGSLPSDVFQFGTSVVKGASAMSTESSVGVKESNERAKAVSLVSEADVFCFYIYFH